MTILEKILITNSLGSSTNQRYLNSCPEAIFMGRAVIRSIHCVIAWFFCIQAQS